MTIIFNYLVTSNDENLESSFFSLGTLSCAFFQTDRFLSHFYESPPLFSPLDHKLDYRFVIWAVSVYNFEINLINIFISSFSKLDK